MQRPSRTLRTTKTLPGKRGETRPIKSVSNIHHIMKNMSDACWFSGVTDSYRSLYLLRSLRCCFAGAGPRRISATRRLGRSACVCVFTLLPKLHAVPHSSRGPPVPARTDACKHTQLNAVGRRFGHGCVLLWPQLLWPALLCTSSYLQSSCCKPQQLGVVNHTVCVCYFLRSEVSRPCRPHTHTHTCGPESLRDF